MRKTLIIFSIIIVFIIGFILIKFNRQEDNKDIHDYLKEYRNNKDSILLDVRTKEEYLENHIKDSINIPLQDIDTIKDIYDKDKIIYVYCRSGNRSKTATNKLKEYGYINVYNIGGIIDYIQELDK